VLGLRGKNEFRVTPRYISKKLRVILFLSVKSVVKKQNHCKVRNHIPFRRGSHVYVMRAFLRPSRMTVGGRYPPAEAIGMDDRSGYQIEIQGRVDEKGLNEAGPLLVSRVRGDDRSTVFEVQTDQSGLIGLLRHLHGRGAVLISVKGRGLEQP
jgi:hypothetical protein